MEQDKELRHTYTYTGTICERDVMTNPWEEDGPVNEWYWPTVTHVEQNKIRSLLHIRHESKSH